MRSKVALTGVAFAALSVSAVAKAEELPALRWDRPVRCMTDLKNKPVRVQCESTPEALVCLVAPAKGWDGADLERTQPCEKKEGPEAYVELLKGGTRIVPAVAEAPPGYMRSKEGHPYQVRWDLRNRFYVGASWTPTLDGPQPQQPVPDFSLGRGRAEGGLELTWLSPQGRSRHDMRILEGGVTFSDLHVDAVLFQYDYQHLHRRATFWLTTFFGDCQVHPVTLPLGWGMRVLSIDDRPPAFSNALDMELAEVHMSWNPWQSSDMYSTLRFEAGLSAGKYWENRSELQGGLGTGAAYIGPTARVKSQFAIDDRGLHHIVADVSALPPHYFSGQEATLNGMRVRGLLGYEGILFAINDQPISVSLAGTATSREEPGEGPRRTEFAARLGFRVSFWAPARVLQPLPEYEDP